MFRAVFLGLGLIGVACAGCGSSGSASNQKKVFTRSVPYGHAAYIQTRAFRVGKNWELDYSVLCQQDPSSTTPGGQIAIAVQPGTSHDVNAMDATDMVIKNADKASFDGSKNEPKSGYYRLLVNATKHCAWTVRAWN